MTRERLASLANKLVYYTSNFIIMYFDVLILEDVNHTWILCVFDRVEKQHWKSLSD